MDRVNTVQGIQTRWGFLWKVANWGRPEEVLGWKLICPPLNMKRLKIQWPTTRGNGMCQCFIAPLGMTITCIPMSSSLCKGFLGDLVRSLDEDGTLSNVLWMLAEHYDIMMTFHALSKELYSLKQGMGENVSEFGVCLSHQVQVLQTEYPGRIQQEHVEEMKWGHFYKGLSPWVLADIGPQHWWWKSCHLFQIAPSCPETGKMRQKQETSCSQKSLLLGVQM